MPRSPTSPFNYSLPPIYLATPNTTIVVDQHNTPLEDIASTFNTVTPLNFGGTGASTKAGVQTAFSITPTSQSFYLATGGTANAQTLTPSDPLASLVDGVAYHLIATTAPTGAATLNVSSTGALAIRKISGGTDVAITAGDMLAAGRYLVEYSSAASSGAGGWILVNPQFTSLFFVPTGGLMDYAGSSAPTGWVLCFGQAISRTTFAALFAIIGTAYGSGDGSTTFNVPDFRGRVGAGADNMGGSAANRLTNSATGGVNGNALGNAGGEQAHQLIISELAAHTHQINASAQGNSPLGSGTTPLQNTGGGNNTTSTGGDTAHNNVQPTLIINKIIKT